MPQVYAAQGRKFNKPLTVFWWPINGQRSTFSEIYNCKKFKKRRLRKIARNDQTKGWQSDKKKGPLKRNLHLLLNCSHFLLLRSAFTTLKLRYNVLWHGKCWLLIDLKRENSSLKVKIPIFFWLYHILMATAQNFKVFFFFLNIVSSLLH